VLPIALLLSVLPGAADAEDEPLPAEGEELVVVSSTVAKDREDPASFSDFDAEQIQSVNAGQDLSTLLGETMNAYSYSDAGNGYGYSYLRIRGFDQARIAVNVNGVPLNTPESHQVYSIDLGDFATGLGMIQVQRGPGTALYGSPAVGGVVNLETARIPAVKGGELALSIGSFGTSRVSLGYGGSIGTSPWAYFVRAAHVQSDGYRDPSWSRQTYLHLGFERFAPESVWRIVLFGGPEATQLAYFGVPKDYLSDDKLRRTNFLLPGETDTFVQPQLQVMNDRRLAPGLFLKNTVYGILGDGYFRQFASALEYNPQGNPLPDATIDNAWSKRALNNRQVGWIPRLSYSHKGGELTAGMELLFHRGRHDGKVTGDGVTTPLVLYDFTNGKDTINLFLREAVAVAKNATLDLEIQATRHRFTMRDDRVRGISWDGDYSYLSPRIGANWNISDRWNVYGRVTKTESEPTFNNVWDPEDTSSDPASRFASYDPSNNRYADPNAKPERLTSFELGAGFVQGATRVKMNLYRMQFHDEFVFAGALDNDGIPVTTNAGKSLHQGIEVEARGRIPGDVDLSGYLAISDDVLEQDTLLSPDGAGTTYVIDYSGNRVALFPEHTARFAIARTFGVAAVELSARHIGRIYLDNSENERKAPANRAVAGYVDKQVDPFTLVAAQAVFDLSHAARRPARGLLLRVRCDNLLDANVAQFGYSYPLDPAYTTFYSEFFPAPGRSFVAGLDFAF
jgi:iron complex outermembrane receptor protein